MSKGHIRQRGKQSWELKFDAGRDPATGERKIQYHSFKGGKRAAQAKLAELIASVGAGSYVEPSKITVAEHVRARVIQWEASGTISARTAQRYCQLIENQIAPHLGDKLVQKLKPMDIEAWHNELRTGGRRRGAGGVATRTIGHAHRVLSKALNDAVRNDMVSKNVCTVQPAPKVDDVEMQILKAGEVGTIVAQLKGHPIYASAMLALFAGMRLGEILALRWANIDLENRIVRVREALEETRAHGIRPKMPKTKAGRRDITLPRIVIDALSDHRRQQLELRLQLGLGKLPDDALVFPTIEGGPQSPSDVSRTWGLVAASLGIPDITFHALRHTHASQLIEAKVDLVTISRRLGHAKPTITLAVYAHLFQQDDGAAASAIDEALTGHASA